MISKPVDRFQSILHPFNENSTSQKVLMYVSVYMCAGVPRSGGDSGLHAAPGSADGARQEH